MKILHVRNSASLNIFYENSALTMVGLKSNAENLAQFEAWLASHDALIKDEACFWIVPGRMMNEKYELTGDNRYPDDLSIVVVDSGSINILKIIIARFQIGARWFDDIVDNNLRREGRFDETIL